MKLYSIALLLFFSALHLKLNSQYFFTAIDGAKIYYEDIGQGETVLLLHGFINTSQNWMEGYLPAHLKAKGYRIIIPDLRGNGLSSKPHTIESYKDNAEIRDVVSLLDSLGIDKFHVVGYSRGAIIAAKLANLYGENLISLTLGGMGLDFTNPDWPKRKMMAEAFAGNPDQYPQCKGALDWARKCGADFVCMSLLQMTQPVTSIEALRQLGMPTLVIAGNQDKDNGDPAILSSVIPQSQLVIIDGNHNQSHSSIGFAEAVTRFLAGIKK